MRCHPPPVPTYPAPPFWPSASARKGGKDVEIVSTKGMAMLKKLSERPDEAFAMAFVDTSRPAHVLLMAHGRDRKQ
jgi:hypothetical protein